MLNFINIILLISSIIKAYLSINEDPIYEMDAHELIELLMGYRVLILLKNSLNNLRSVHMRFISSL